MYYYNMYGLLEGGIDRFNNSSSNNLFSSIVILVLFFGILIAAYYFTRFLGRFQMRQSKQSNMKIVEAIPVGPGKTIQLVKVGEKFVLLGVTKDQITFITEVDEEALNLEQLKTSVEGGQDFSRYLSRFMDKKKKNKEDE